MAQTSYPFDGQAVTEAQFSAFFKELQDSGVAGSASGTELKVTADSGGMRVFVAAGSAIVRGFFYNNDASVQLTIAAAAVSTRYDRVVLRLDPSANSIVLAVVQGTAGGGLPALTQTTTGIFELPLATVTVTGGASNIAPSAVADVRPLTGTRIGVWQTTTRPASPRQYQLGFNTTTSRFEFWDGAQWVAQDYAAASHSHSPSYRAGFASVNIDTSSSAVSFSVTFSSPMAVSNPAVMLTRLGDGVLKDVRLSIVSVSSTGFTAWAIMGSGTFPINGTVGVYWTAMERV